MSRSVSEVVVVADAHMVLVGHDSTRGIVYTTWHQIIEFKNNHVAHRVSEVTVRADRSCGTDAL